MTIIHEILHQRSNKDLPSPPPPNSKLSVPSTSTNISESIQGHHPANPVNDDTGARPQVTPSKSHAMVTLGLSGNLVVLAPSPLDITSVPTQKPVNTANQNDDGPKSLSQSQPANSSSDIESTVRNQLQNASILSLYNERARLKETIDSLTTTLDTRLTPLERQSTQLNVSVAKKKLETVQNLIVESPELDEVQFRLDMPQMGLPLLQSFLYQLDEHKQRLKAALQLPLDASLRQENERRLSIVARKQYIINQAIHKAWNLDGGEREPISLMPELTFDENHYREQLSAEGQGSLEGKLVDILAEKRGLIKSMQDLMSPERRQNTERQLSIVDKKRAILLERINQKAHFDKASYRSQFQNSPAVSLHSTSTQLQEELAWLRGDLDPSLPSMMKKRKEEEIELVLAKLSVVRELIHERSTEMNTSTNDSPSPNIQLDTLFNEAQYVSQMTLRSLTDLRNERDAQQQHSGQLIRELQSSLSPDRRGAVEKQLSVIGKKRAVLNRMIQEAETSSVHSKSKPSTLSRGNPFTHPGDGHRHCQRMIRRRLWTMTGDLRLARTIL
ncbi:hypothetical protein FRC17_004524 [Serendipita sp. 399]|nr:hypothetical protein FRC17_004524 [Serendipita sp. 399]